MKKIIVTGGTGFIGANLCRRLICDSNNYVICLDNFYCSEKNNIADIIDKQNFEFVEHNVVEPYDIDVDEIYNLACPASPKNYQWDPIFTVKTCVEGAINSLDLAKKCNAKVMQFSTSEIYGNPDVHPQSESYNGNVNCTGPRSCYDEGKRIAESIFFDYYRLYSIDIKVIRIFNTYGPFMDKNDGRAISNFITKALSDDDIEIYGDGSQTRSFQYIDDLIDAVIKYMNIKDVYPGPINLGNPEEITINELAKLILKKTNSKSKIINCKLPEDDPWNRKPNINLAKAILKDWQPMISLDEGIEKTIKYFMGEK